MKSVVKAQSLVALDKPPYTWVVAEDEITFKQELRSSKPEIAYHISDKVPIYTPVVVQQPTPSQKTPSAPLRPPDFDEVFNPDGTPKSEEGDPLVDDPEPADPDGVNSELEQSLPLLSPEQTDSDNDSDMAEERTIAPIQFNGSANVDAEQWLKHFENYCAYKNYDESKKLALCKILLTGNAAAWLDTLSDAITGTWDALKEGFLQRYLTPEFMHFKSARLIFNTKMQPNDTVDD